MKDKLTVNSRPLSEITSIIVGMLNMQTFTTTNSFGFEQPIDVAIPFLQGPPGIGKTAIITQVCHQYGFNLMSVHYGLKPLEDVSGLPDFGNMITINGAEIKSTRFTPPDIVSLSWELYNKEPDKLIVIFLDDFHMAPPLLKSLGYEMFTSKSLRNYKFPPKTAFILAGNVGKKAGSEKIPSPIVNRIAVLNVDVSFDAWKKDFAIPNGVNSKIINFLSNPKYQKYFQQEEQINNAWASPRSWVRWSTLLNNLEQFMDISHADLLYYTDAHVGPEAASDFSAYYKLYANINATAYINGEIPIVVPDVMADKYIFMLACISEFFKLYAETQNQTKRNTFVQNLSDIIIGIAATSREIAITGLREIILTENSLKLRNIYMKLRSQIQLKDESLVNKIHDDSFNITG